MGNLRIIKNQRRKATHTAFGEMRSGLKVGDFMETKDLTLEDLDKKLDFLLENFKTQKEIYTFQEACDYLCIGRTTMTSEINKGNIRFKLKGSGSQKIFKKEWLDDWMEI